MLVGDIKREQAMRFEVFKQENESKEAELKNQDVLMSEQRRQYEEAFEQRKQTVSQHLTYIDVMRNERKREPNITTS